MSNGPNPAGGGSGGAASSTETYLELKPGATVVRGSVATTRMRFPVIVRSSGLADTAFTIADSAENGTTVQVLESGNYFIGAHCHLSTVGSLSIRITATDPDNTFDTISGEYTLGYGNGNNSVAASSGIKYITSGSYISVASYGSLSNYPELCRLIIYRA